MKKLVRLLFGLLIILIITGGYYFRYYLFLPDWEYWCKNRNRSPEEFLILSESFNQINLLKSLSLNPRNGFYYRLDDNLDQVNYAGSDSKTTKSEEKERNLDFEFANPEEFTWLLPDRKPRIGNGILEFRAAPGDYLETSGDLNIPQGIIQEIEIRARMKCSTEMEVGWSGSTDHGWDEVRMGRIKIETKPGDRFYIYRINAAAALKKKLDADDKIRKFFLRPSTIKGDLIEIDYIRLISKNRKYRRSPFGTGYETLDKVMRKILHLNSPGSLTYRLKLPEVPVNLRFGLGVLDDSEPVICRVLLKGNGNEQEVFSRQLTKQDSWEDIEPIELSPWKNQEVTIRLEAASQNNNTTFWSNPIIYQSPSPEPFNVVIVLEDALRADHLSLYGYRQETSPSKDRLLQDGIIFLNAISQATMTRPSCPSLMTSLYPSTTGVWNFQEMLNENYLTLPEIMRHQGFTTAAFIQNVAAGPAAGLHQGYSYLYDQHTCGYHPDNNFRDLIRTWLKNHSDRNFFLYIHLLDPHGPYNPQPPGDKWYKNYQGPTTPVERQDKPGFRIDPSWVDEPSLEGRTLLYDGEVLDNDLWLDNFIEFIKERGFLSRTLIVFLSDHGEFLGEYNEWGHHPPGRFPVIHPPLMIYYPAELPGNLRIEEPVQLIDVMPTILDLSGIATENFLLQGDSLLPLIRGENSEWWENRLCVSEEVSLRRSKEDKNNWGSLFYRDRHLLYSDKLSGEGKQQENEAGLRIYNYQKDLGGIHTLSIPFGNAILKPRVRDFLHQFQEHNLRIHRNIIGDNTEVSSHDPEVLKQLKALGYLQ